MLQEINHKASAVICEALRLQTETRENCVADPEAYFLSIYSMKAGILGLVFGERLPEGALFHKLINTCTLAEQNALNTFENWFNSKQFKDVSLSDLYELMLLLEFPIRDNSITENVDDLNSIGSFYTPLELSDAIVELTINQYIKANTGKDIKALILSSTFADYSCGTGRFFLSLIAYCKAHLNLSGDELKTLALNFRAIEADSLSLEIAKLEILTAIDALELYDELSSNFVHGNPLIQPETIERSTPFCNENYYLNVLAINADAIPTCDVLFGNPPWGSVEFDLPFYFHLLCPHLNELEDENELAKATFALSETHPELYNWLLHNDEAVDFSTESIYNDARFSHSTLGGLQTNLLFTELSNSLLTPTGTCGLLLKGSTLSDVNKPLRTYLQSNKRLIAQYDFVNQNRILNLETEQAFTVAVLGNQIEETTFKTNLTRVSELN